MKLDFLQSNVNNPYEYLRSVAKARGCGTQEEIDEFLNPLPSINNTISSLTDYVKGRDRLVSAVEKQEKIVIYGDYDVDGITSLVQLIDFIKATGHTNHAWFIPDRIADNYGLTFSGLEKCIHDSTPQLVITVDCGSNSIDEIKWLKEKGIDCIVIDHHEVVQSDKRHPSIAHLNPKAFEPVNEELASMCASGFTFLFCEQIASDESISNWNRNRSLLLAGLGTLADVMPLVGINRALVKHSLKLANDENELKQIPGLVALKNVSKTKEVKSYTYGFQWGPRLNAMGRLEEATASVKLLLSKAQEEAEPYAEMCDRTNTERQNMQDKIIEETTEQAQALVGLGHKVIVVVGKEWHTGIVGIVASRIKETYNRPAIVCGWHEEDACWKGSGRSVDGFDLGGATESAVNEEILLGGGGHKMACGLSFTNEKLSDLRDWMNSKCPLTEDDFVPSYTVLGYSFAQPPETWLDIYDKLEPFGNGNPKPLLYLQGTLMWSDEKRTRDGERVWGVKGGFRCVDGPDKLLYLTWSDVERAMTEWQKGNDYQMVIKLRKSVKEYPGETRTYYNRDVEDCELL